MTGSDESAASEDAPPDWRAVLQAEFGAEDGAFILTLRIELEWDRVAFTRLSQAMEACCKDLTGTETVERWLASGFWYAPNFTRNWTSHPSWQPIVSANPAYYEACYERLDDLAYWFFVGESPKLNPMRPL